MTALHEHPTPTAAGPAPQRRPGPLTFWSAVGALTIALTAYCWTRWILSGNFTRAETGTDSYDYLWYLRTFEITATAAGVVMLWCWVIRPWRRSRHVPIDGKILLGMMFAYVVDPTLNVFNSAFAMNAHSVSYGSWGPWLPLGWSADEERFAEGLLWAPQLYMYFGLFAAMAGCVALRWLRRRCPRASNPTLYATVFVAFTPLAFVVEMIFLVLPQLYVFPGVPSNFSVFTGEVYQYPFYQALFAAVFGLMVTWLRDSVDETGRSAVERGVDRLPIAEWRRHAMSFCAVTGFCTASALSYFLPYGYASMSADTYVELPSYLAPAAYCGVEGKPMCASEYLDRLQNGTTE
ncbi:spirocyclase AveC family protein [Sporichthya polymorpha]|uniref:spirocyclase AveC family protein n=1 Tax=Sporichthya polymorpha TaxID=35751 RepID=UPI00037586C4|nr:spirocyclase AveC family protein [Sporichthya polymorpha]